MAGSAVFAVYFGRKQLINLNRNLNHNNLMSILEIEFELNRRKERLSDITHEITKELLQFNIGSINETQRKHIKMMDGHRKEAYENYLNIFDRLCNFILKNKIEEEDFRLEFRDMLFETIKADKENTFNNATSYRNMIKLQEKWKDM